MLATDWGASRHLRLGVLLVGVETRNYLWPCVYSGLHEQYNVEHRHVYVTDQLRLWSVPVSVRYKHQRLMTRRPSPGRHSSAIQILYSIVEMTVELTLHSAYS